MTGPSTPNGESPVRLAAVGDLLLPSGAPGACVRDPASLFSSLSPVLAGSDLVVGNLECTLPGDGETVPTEPRVVSTPESIRAIKSAGFNVITLANNHTFDCRQAGFHNVCRLLGELGIAHFGAGDNLAEASAPAILEIRGVKVAFLAAVDRRTGTGDFAGPDRFGIAPMDVDRLVDDIRRLRDRVHHVVLSLHWGEERLPIPSPEQVEQAHRLAEAGASLILGHHPHVIQGMETWKAVPILYSQGNVVASEVPYMDGDRITWNRKERTGCLVLAELTPAEVRNVRQVPTYDSGCPIIIDRSGYGDKIIARANRALARGVTLKRYRREYLWAKTLKPAFQHLRWSQLRKLRPDKIRKALAGIGRARKAE